MNLHEDSKKTTKCIGRVQNKIQFGLTQVQHFIENFICQKVMQKNEVKKRLKILIFVNEKPF